MKRIFRTLLIMLVFCLIGQTGRSQPKLFEGIGEEYEIDFSQGFYKPRNKGDSTIYWFGKKVKAGTDLLKVQNSELSIRVSAFDKLYRVAKDNLPPKIGNNPTGVTGFMIYYGLSRVNKIELFFRPWIMEDLKKKGGDLHGIVKILDPTSIYIYDEMDSSFLEYRLGSDEFQYYEQSTKRFRDITRIQDKGSKRGFEYCEFDLKNWRCDTQSAFFTFSQLIDLYKLNYEDDNSDTYRNHIVTYEGVILKEFQIHGSKRTRVQRWVSRSRNKITSLLLADNDGREFAKQGVFKVVSEKDGKNYYGNLSGLCPPGCNEFRYPIIND